jgi:HEPN domain-containing protein
MNEDIVKQWIIKAEHDLMIALPAFENKSSVTDMICYHFQQCAEKYLKAFLISNNVEIKKTHVISVILEQCISIDNDFLYLKEQEIDILSIYATEARYPDDFYMPSFEETLDAYNKTVKVKEFILKKLDIQNLNFLND